MSALTQAVENFLSEYDSAYLIAASGDLALASVFSALADNLAIQGCPKELINHADRASSAWYAQATEMEAR